MAKYQQYEEYKDSGAEWLGEVPIHWKVLRLKQVIEYGSSVSYGIVQPGEALDEGVKFIQTTNISKGSFDLNDFQKTSVLIESNYPRSRLKGGEVILGIRASIGAAFVVPDTFRGINLSRGIARIATNKSLTSEFLVWYFKADAVEKYWGLSKQGSTFSEVSIETVRELYVPIPNTSDQTQIANFLDHETAQIDTLIDKQQTLIQLLKEKRQAVISHAVTKGLNTDAPMKDSGVEWLGDVPEHWEFIKFDYVINAVGDIDHYMPSSTDSGIPYVMTGDLRDLVSEISFENCKQVAHSDYVKLSRKIKASKDDIIFARYATIGTLSYVDIDADFLVSYSCVIIKPNSERTSGKYLFRYLKSQAFLQAITMYINSNTQCNVGIDSLKNVKVIMPPLSEQEEIINFLNDAVVKIDRLLDKAKSAITLMQERRIALISAAVTGKIDVRGWESKVSDSTY